MISSINTLSYLCQVTGKSILSIWDDIELKEYFFLLDAFTPASPSNHIPDNTVAGRDLSGILVALGGFSHGNSATSDAAILTKIEEIPVQKFVFHNFKWLKINM